MRVIAGQFGGRKLTPAHNVELRPATDRIKESIFNVLQNKLSLNDAEVLDLFAGTGSLGIEALSRGAKHATFVDTSEKSLQILRSNLVLLGCEPQSTVIKTDAFSFIKRSEGQFNLIFADPPYALADTPEIPSRIFSGNLLKNKGFLIIEHSKRTQMPGSALQKEFGQTIVSFFTHK